MVDFTLTEEQEMLRQLARDFAKSEVMPVAKHHDETGEFPVAVVKKAWEAGLLNTKVPDAYGGLGLGVFESCLIAEELGYGCTGITTAIEAERLAVRDARRCIAIADDDVTGRDRALDAIAVLVAVRDEQQLQHVGGVAALTGECRRDLLRNRRLVAGKCEELDAASRRFAARLQATCLRLLPALIQAFERHQRAGHDSSATMSSTVCRRRATRQAPPVTSTSAGNARRL